MAANFLSYASQAGVKPVVFCAVESERAASSSVLPSFCNTSVVIGNRELTCKSPTLQLFCIIYILTSTNAFDSANADSSQHGNGNSLGSEKQFDSASFKYLVRKKVDTHSTKVDLHEDSDNRVLDFGVIDFCCLTVNWICFASLSIG